MTYCKGRLVVAFYNNDKSSNPAEVYSFSRKNVAWKK